METVLNTSYSRPSWWSDRFVSARERLPMLSCVRTCVCESREMKIYHEVFIILEAMRLGGWVDQTLATGLLLFYRRLFMSTRTAVRTWSWKDYAGELRSTASFSMTSNRVLAIKIKVNILPCRCVRDVSRSRKWRFEVCDATFRKRDTSAAESACFCSTWLNAAVIAVRMNDGSCERDSD